MTNPKLRTYPLIGGPLDGGHIALLPDYSNGDEDEPIPPEWIQVEQEGYVTISRRSPADIIRQDKTNVYLSYQLAMLVGKSYGTMRHYRYLYAVAWHTKDAEWMLIDKGNVQPPISKSLNT